MLDKSKWTIFSAETVTSILWNLKESIKFVEIAFTFAFPQITTQYKSVADGDKLSISQVMRSI